VKYFKVRNFEKFQHYKNSNPTWIKLYVGVLHDYDFSLLSDTERLQVLLIWLLAAKTGNRVPWDEKWVQREIKTDAPVNLNSLKEKGFIEALEKL
jgi:hypothetical protein